MKAETKTIIAFNCLCCNRVVEIEHLEDIKASEHICQDCKAATPNAYQFMLSAMRMKSQGKD